MQIYKHPVSPFLFFFHQTKTSFSYQIGSMDLHTNYRRDYMTPELSSTRGTSNGTKEIVHEQKVYTRRPMNGISQTSFDFRPYSKQRPPPPAANMEPFVSQVSIGNTFTPIERFVFINKTSLEK
jgi:hypothetical protein